PKVDTKLTGSAGEHYVCSMLARYGCAASLTRDGLERTDVLAVHVVERHMIEVQVKAVRTGSWMLGRKGPFQTALAGSGTSSSGSVPRPACPRATWSRETTSRQPPGSATKR